MKKNNHEYSLSRRDFFTKLALASIAASLPPMVIGCSSKPKFQGSGKAPYKVWEEMLLYIKTSPDYLPGRMQKLINDGNAEAMFNFVRDELYLIPENSKAIGAGNAFKWGTDYALRSGMATMWEKASILNKMYQQAGINSEVVFERTNITVEEVPDFFFRPIKREFAPEITQGMLRHWAKELEISKSDLEYNQVLKDEEYEAETLGNKIYNTLNLPDNFYYRNFDFRWPNYNTPTVRFIMNGETKYAHLFDTKVPFGSLREGNKNAVKKAGKAKNNDYKVSIKINYRDSIEPLKEKELIHGEWLAFDLAGRQLDLQFLHGLTLEEMVVTPAGNIRTFTPALSLQAMDKNQKFMEERSILGAPITLSGKKIHLNNQGDAIQVGDASILKPSDDTIIKQVDSLKIKAKSIGYPQVKLTITPTDNTGKIVEGIQARDFSIIEDGKPIKALMENNQRTPRILIMADTSMSMPREYQGAGMANFISNLKKNILQKYPAAIIQNWETPSSLFTWLLKASQTENDLVIYATDGDNNDNYDANNEATYRNGPPAIVLNVYKSELKYRTDTFDKMASITNGVHLPIADQQEAIEKISAYLDTLEIQPYTFTYNAVGTQEERKVEVSIDSKRHIAKTTYRIDTKWNSETIGPRIIGLYLEVKYANQYPIKRVLAGWQNDIHPKKKPSQQMANEVNDLMLGSMQFYFEGAGPTFSATIADVLTARLSTRAWGEPLFENDIEKTKETFVNGQFNIDDKAMALLAPLCNAATGESLSIPGGLQIGVRTFRPGAMTKTASSLYDYLNTSDYHTIARDGKKGFKINLLKTAQLAVREGKLFQKSTWSELDDKEWINLKQARQSNWFVAHKEKDNYYWRERIDRGAELRVFDQNAISKAFYNINKTTGELYGYLSNGNGGGEDNLGDIMTALSSLMAIMGRYGMIHPVGGLALGIVVEYGKTLVKLYAIASETIMIMDASRMDSKIAEALQKFACEAHVSIIFSLLGNTGELMAGLNTLIGQITGKGVCG